MKRRKSRRRARARTNRKPQKHVGFVMAEMESPFRHLTSDQHAEAVRQVAANVRAEHNRLLNRIDVLIRQCNPLQMLAHFAFYDRAMFDIQQRGSYRPLQQNAVEFFHGYFLTVPIDALKTRATPTEVILELNEVLHGIAETFGLLDIGKVRSGDDAETTASILHEMRMQTHMIRNPGYYQQVMRQLKAVFGRLDEPYRAITGVKLSSLVGMCENIVRLLEQRLTRRMLFIRATARCKTAEEVVRTYCEVSDIDASDRQRLLDAYSTVAPDVDSARAICVQDADRRLIGYYVFGLNDFATAYAEPVEEVALRDVLDQWSYPPEGLLGFPRDRLFLDNPIWQRPLIQLRPPDYLWPSPELFHSFGWEMMERLLRPHSALVAAYQNEARPKYLEFRVAELCHSFFPGAQIWQNCEWATDGRSYETDVLIVFDCIALVIECKSARITPAARRGAPERLQREIKKLIEDSSRQSARLADILLHNTAPFTFKSKAATHHVAAGAIKKVIRLNVILDTFGSVACAMREMVDAKLIDASVGTAATMAESDFENVLRLLDSVAERLHYLARRSEVERNLELFADEEDLLACYLATGMNLGSAEFGQHRRMMVSPLGNQLQPYLASMHKGTPVMKPRRRFTGWWKELLRIVEARGFRSWTLISLVLLDVRHEDQRRFERMTRRMLKNVRSNWRSPHCINSVVLANGPIERRTGVVSIGVKRVTREERQTTISRAVARASAEAKLMMLSRSVWTRRKQYGPTASSRTHL
jgi:hypothetical protein